MKSGVQTVKDDLVSQQLPSPFISVTPFNLLTHHYKCPWKEFLLRSSRTSTWNSRGSVSIINPYLLNYLCHPDAPPSGSFCWAVSSLCENHSREGPYVESHPLEWREQIGMSGPLQPWPAQFLELWVPREEGWREQRRVKRVGVCWGQGKGVHPCGSWRSAETQGPLSVPFLQPCPGQRLLGWALGSWSDFLLCLLCSIILVVF